MGVKALGLKTPHDRVKARAGPTLSSHIRTSAIKLAAWSQSQVVFSPL